MWSGVTRVEINNGGHQVVIDDPSGQRRDVARDARKLWDQTRLKPNGAGFGTPDQPKDADR